MRFMSLVCSAVLMSSCAPAAPDPRGVEHDETLLTVTATGRADSRPDEARLQLGVQSLAASAEEASRLNREKMTRVTDSLTALGVKADDLQTRNLSLQRIDYGRDRGRFRAENILEVTLRDASKAGEAVTAVTTAGANVLSGPDLQVSDREGSTRSAYAAAYKAARARAEAYAGAADLRIDRVLGIYDGGEYGVAPPSPPPPPLVRTMSAEAAAAPQASAPFYGGTNQTEVRVRVDFALSPK